MFAERAAAVADGALHLLQQPMALAVLASVVLVIRDSPRQHAATALTLFAAAAAMTLALEPGGWQSRFVSGCLALLGAICASGLRPPLPVVLALCAAAGLALGFGAGVPFATPAEALGTLAVAGLLSLVLLAGWRAVIARWPSAPLQQIAPRVAAAWLLALGLLMLALAILRH